MSALDLALVIGAVAAAAGFLVWQIGLRRSRPPACHPRGASHEEADDVVVGDALARGLKAANDKRRD